MSKELLKNKEFLKIINEFLKKSEVIDVLLIGSVIRGKEKPNDIDLIVVYTEKAGNIAELDYALKKKLNDISKDFEITGKKYSELFKSAFIARESLLSEAYSFRSKNFFSRGLGYQNLILFKYSLKTLSSSKKIQLHYSLYGRGREMGFIERNGCYKFADNTLLCPIENSELLKEFFTKWKIEYFEFPIILPGRIVKYKLKIISKNK
jgi:predicted nucleotidyltransferase